MQQLTALVPVVVAEGGDFFAAAYLGEREEQVSVEDAVGHCVAD